MIRPSLSCFSYSPDPPTIGNARRRGGQYLKISGEKKEEERKKKGRRTDHDRVEVGRSAGLESEVSFVKHSIGSLGLLSSSDDGRDDSGSLESSVDGEESLDVEAFADVESDLSSLGGEGLPLSVDLRKESTGVTGVGDGSGGGSEREGLSDFDRELLVDLSDERRTSQRVIGKRSEEWVLTLERLSSIFC